MLALCNVEQHLNRLFSLHALLKAEGSDLTPAHLNAAVKHLRQQPELAHLLQCLLAAV